jgi:hypothetical protein
MKKRGERLEVENREQRYERRKLKVEIRMKEGDRGSCKIWEAERRDRDKGQKISKRERE